MVEVDQQQVQEGLDQTINQRAGAELHVNTHEERKGAMTIDSDNWIEVRLQGKLPERRANHCAFILTLRNEEYLYVHGGRDLKEGSIASMWRLNLSSIHSLMEDDGNFNAIADWELVQTTGRGPGRISHHTASVRPSKEVVFYGGLKGEDSSNEIFLFNPNTNAWLAVTMSNQSQEVLPRDDHVMSDLSDGSFLVFGGFVSGSRVNELAKFSMTNTQTISGTMLSASSTSEMNPMARASMSSCCYNDKLYIFGGQDDDNGKLDDLWEYDQTTSAWRQIQIPEGGLHPLCRSGHTAVTYGTKMYIFGGILELTKELNDMIVFDFNSMSFVQGEERPDFMDGSPERRPGATQQEQFDGSSSPTRTQKGNSPGRRKTIGASPTLRSPMKSRRVGSPGRTIAEGAGGNARREGLGTPTSVTMMNTFIIKNADNSFDQYHQQMKKRRQFGGYDANATSNENKFGLIRGAKPTARDGHISIVDSKGYMYVFGGDRHLMPFNDLYMIKLQ